MYSQSQKPKKTLKQGEADTYLDTLRSKYNEFKMLPPPSHPPPQKNTPTPTAQTVYSTFIDLCNNNKNDFIAILNTITPKVYTPYKK